MRYIWITTEKEMIHRYLNAPKSVEFLKNLHRHIMKFKVYIAVTHNDRDIEFIDFKRFIDECLTKIGTNVGAQSCEMISDSLCLMIRKKYKERDIIIEVSEDGENGSRIEYWSQDEIKRNR